MQPQQPNFGSPQPDPNSFPNTTSSIPPNNYPSYGPNSMPPTMPLPPSNISGVQYTPIPSNTENNYDFILNNNTSKSSPLQNLTLVKKIIFGLILGMILILFFGVINNIVNNNSAFNNVAMINIAADQTEILHLLNNTVNSPVPGQTLSASNQDFVGTGILSMTDQQTSFMTFLANYGVKPSPVQLNAKISTSLDNQLTAAGAASTYDQTFTQIMENQLSSYMADLSYAYKTTSIPQGRTLLQKDYIGAKLLLRQLKTSYS